MLFPRVFSSGAPVWLGLSCLFAPLLGAAADDDALGPPPFVQATGALEQGDLEAAERLTVPLTAGAAVAPEALSLLGQIRLRQGRAAEAAALFERVLAEKPESAPAHARLAEALWERSKDAADDARAVLRRRAGEEYAAAHRLDGHLIDAHMGLVRWYFAAPAAAPEGALERHAEAASQIDPWDTPTRSPTWPRNTAGSIWPSGTMGGSPTRSPRTPGCVSSRRRCGRSSGGRWRRGR